MYSDRTRSLIEKNRSKIVALLEKETNGLAQRTLLAAITDGAAGTACSQAAEEQFSEDLKALKTGE